MDYSDLFEPESNLIGTEQLQSIYFHYIGDNNEIYDTLGSLRFAATDEGKPVFLYKVEAGGKVGDDYVIPNLDNLQAVSIKEYQLYVNGVK